MKVIYKETLYKLPKWKLRGQQNIRDKFKYMLENGIGKESLSIKRHKKNYNKRDRENSYNHKTFRYELVGGIESESRTKIVSQESSYKARLYHKIFDRYTRQMFVVPVRRFTK